MPWSERQIALLREMGVRVFAPAARGAAAAPAQDKQASRGSAAAMPADRIDDAAADAVSDRRPVASRAAPPPTTVASAPHEPADSADPGRARRIATLGWGDLEAAVRSCRACGLCEGRTQTVFGVGHRQAHWMIVGEAPGEQEDRQGEPFVGAAGQLLDNMLQALALSRAADGPPERRVFIANTLKCRPPRNRNPAPAEMERCEPFLLRQLELVNPRIVLAMGRFAVQALLRSTEAIGKLRGRVHRFHGVPLIVTYHPAYLLRNLADKARAWEDLCLAADTYDALAAPPAAR
jgi:DNA polymerase